MVVDFRKKAIRKAKEKIRSRARDEFSYDYDADDGSILDRRLRAQEMAGAYDVKLREYRRSGRTRYLKNGKLDPKSRNYHNFVNASVIADDIGMNYFEYVEAQAYYFNKWFNEMPAPWHLCGVNSKFNARDRAAKWRKKFGREEVSVEKSKEVTEDKTDVVAAGDGRYIPASTFISHGQRLLDQMMVTHGVSEKEVLVLFGGVTQGFFDYRFLQQNKTWKRLRKQGQV